MKTMNSKLYSILFTLLLLVIAGCTADSSRRNQRTSEDDVKVMQLDESLEFSTRATNHQQVLQLHDEIQSIYKDQQNTDVESRNVNVLISKIINPLTPILLDTNLMLNDEFRLGRIGKGYSPVSRLVIMYNFALITVNRLAPDRIKPDLFKSYYKQITYNCDPETLGSCPFVKYYRSVDSNQIVKILKIVYELESEDEKKVRVLDIALDIKNGQLDNSLRFLLIKRAAEGLSLSETIKDKDDPEFQARITRDAALFKNLLMLDLSKGNSTEKYRDIIGLLNPWRLSRHSDDPKNPAMSELIDLAGAHLIYGSGNTLLPDFHKVIEEQKYQVGHLDMGVSFQLDNVRGDWKLLTENFNEFLNVKGISSLSYQEKIDKTQFYSDLRDKIKQHPHILLFDGNSRRIIPNLLSGVKTYGETRVRGDKDTKEGDEYDFLVYQLYYGHFVPEDAASMWAHIKNKNVDRLIEAASSFLKIQMVYHTNYTAAAINNFYKINSSAGISELINKLDIADKEINQAWSRVDKGASQLLKFISRYQNSATRKKYLDFLFVAQSVDKNIVHIATYPNMFPLLYYITEKELEQTFTRWWGSWKVDYNTITSNFFSGIENPWFDISRKKPTLSTAQIIYTFQYALKTQMFENYENKDSKDDEDVLKISVEDFFRKVVRRLLSKAERSMRLIGEAYVSNIRSSKEKLDDVLEACTEEKMLQAKDMENLAAAMESPDFKWEKDFAKTLARRSKTKNVLHFNNLNSDVYEYTSKVANSINKDFQKIYEKDTLIILRLLRTEIFGELEDRDSANNESEGGRLEKAEKDAKFNLRLPFIMFDLFKKEYPHKSKEISDIFNDEFQPYLEQKKKFIKLFVRNYRKYSDCALLFVKRDRDIRHAVLFEEINYFGELFDAIYNKLGGLDSAGRAAVDQNVLDELRNSFTDYTQNPRFPKTYRDKRGDSALSPSAMDFYVMDTYGRIQSHINKLFVNPAGQSNYEFEYPPDMTRMPYWGEVDRFTLPINWNVSRESAREQFIRSGINMTKTHFQYLGRWPQVGEVKVNGRVLLNLFKLGRIDMANKDCKAHSVVADEKVYNIKAGSDEFNNNCYEVTAKDVLKYYKDRIQFMNIDARDKYLLGYLNDFDKYLPSFYSELVKYPDEDLLQSYYDVAFDKVMSDVTAQSTKNFWFFDIIKDYAESARSSRKRDIIFPVNESVEPVFEEHFGKWLDDYFYFVKKFLKAVKEENASNPDFDSQYSYNTEVPVKFPTASENSIQPLVSHHMYENRFKEIVRLLDYEISSEFGEKIKKNKEELDVLVYGHPKSDDESPATTARPK